MLLPLAIDTKTLDAATCKAQQITSYQLMERAAGLAVAEIVRHYPNRDTRILVMAGSGNNGGDALVMVRRLYEEGYPVTAFLFAPDGKLTDDCTEAFNHVPQGILNRVSTHMELPELTHDDVIIDGLMGSGLNRPLTDGYAYLVHWINHTGAQVVSIDVPSGLPFDHYEEEKYPAVVRATMTLTFGFPKVNFYMPECAEFVGQWKVLDIGLESPDTVTLATPYRLITRNDAMSFYRPRSRFSHKGTFGHAALVAGSMGMMGAAVMAARCCMRSGAGMLTCYSPMCGYTVLQTAVPEAKFVNVGEDYLQSFALPESASAVAIGPGLGTSRETALALHYLLEHTRRPLLLDADALNLLSTHPEWWKLLPAGTILTPHPKEADRLLASAYKAGMLHSDDAQTSASPDAMSHHRTSSYRLSRVRALAREAHLIIVLKGAFTAVVTADGTTWINSEHGHAGMAVGGTGDTLTGVILGLLACRYQAETAALLGVYLHSAAADISLEGQSEESWLPTDLSSALGRAFRTLG